MNRRDFPVLKKIVYLDSASATLKPKQVVKVVRDFYLKYPLNPHSLNSKLGNKVFQKVREARLTCARFLGASSPEEIIFTSGTTDSLNLISKMLQDKLGKGAEILLSPLNHSSNLVPWLELAKKTKSKVVYSEKIVDKISSRTRIIAYAQTNNTLDVKINPESLYKRASKHKAIVVNDAAQAVSKREVSLEFADVIAFSANKLYGPTGTGVLAVRQKLLNTLTPVNFGGGASENLTSQKVQFKKNVQKFEPGSPNTSGIIGLKAAIDYFILGQARRKEREVANYLFDKLASLSKVKIYSQRGSNIVLFNVQKFHPHDVVSFLGKSNVILRSGNHCLINDLDDQTQTPGFKYRFLPSVRASVAFYNNKKDVDTLYTKLRNNDVFII